jgi:hypothetical protein
MLGMAADPNPRKYHPCLTTTSQTPAGISAL